MAGNLFLRYGYVATGADLYRDAGRGFRSVKKSVEGDGDGRCGFVVRGCDVEDDGTLGGDEGAEREKDGNREKVKRRGLHGCGEADGACPLTASAMGCSNWEEEEDTTAPGDHGRDVDALQDDSVDEEKEEKMSKGGREIEKQEMSDARWCMMHKSLNPHIYTHLPQGYT